MFGAGNAERWMIVDDLERWYCSQTTGQLVKTLFGVVYQVFNSLIYGKFLDLKWKVVWC